MLHSVTENRGWYLDKLESLILDLVTNTYNSTWYNFTTFCFVLFWFFVGFFFVCLFCFGLVFSPNVFWKYLEMFDAKIHKFCCLATLCCVTAFCDDQLPLAL